MDNIQQKFNADASLPLHVANHVILVNKYVFESWIYQLA